MLCTRSLKLDPVRAHGRAYRAVEHLSERALAFYARTLAWVMRHRRATMVFSLGILIGTVVLFRLVPKGFIPSEDTGQLNATTEAAEGTAIESMVQHQQEAAAIVASDSNVLDFMSSVGAGGPNASANQGRRFIHLKPRSQRRLSADQVARALSAKLARVPGSP